MKLCLAKSGYARPSYTKQNYTDMTWAKRCETRLANLKSVKAELEDKIASLVQRNLEQLN